MNESLKLIALRRSGGVVDVDVTTEDKWSQFCGSVLPGLYVGSMAAAHDEDFLKIKNITHVLTAAGGLNVHFSVESGITHHILHGFADHPCADFLSEVQAALEFVDNAIDSKGNVLVHCASGVSRSVGICCAWLMLRQKLTFHEAIAVVRRNRPCGNPNIGFKVQLLALEQSGDISIAKQIFKQQLGDSTVTDIIRTQRENSCSLHNRVDDIENNFKSSEHLLLTGCDESEDLMEVWIARLHELQEEVSQVSADVTWHLQDKPAESMRKSAKSKIERLLTDIHHAKEKCSHK